MWVREVVDLDGDVNGSFADYISHHYAHAQPGPRPAVRGPPYPKIDRNSILVLFGS